MTAAAYPYTLPTPFPGPRIHAAQRRIFGVIRVLESEANVVDRRQPGTKRDEGPVDETTGLAGGSPRSSKT